MTVYTFQKPALHGDPSGITLCSDKLLRSPAPVFNTTGAPLPGSKLDRWENGDWPQFTSTVSPLYYRAGNGTVSTLTPVIGGAAVSVTGAKGGNAALASLIAALVQAGVPIIDNTSA